MRLKGCGKERRAIFKPLFPNQMMVYSLVRDNLSGTKYLGDSKWLSYNALLMIRTYYTA